MQSVPFSDGGDATGDFLMLLPDLRARLGRAFRWFGPEQRDDALQEATAHAFLAFARLVEQGRRRLAHSASLARYAVAHWFAGRRVGSRLNKHDILSTYCQRRQQIQVDRLQRYDPSAQCWREIVIEDRRTSVPDQAAFRIDFPTWLQQLSHRDRRIALSLAAGNPAMTVARRFRLSRARVSQIRRELENSWLKFHGGGKDADAGLAPRRRLVCRD